MRGRVGFDESFSETVALLREHRGEVGELEILVKDSVMPLSPLNTLLCKEAAR